MLPTLLLMLKAPRIGEVKTRLAREIGASAAASVYRALVEYQFKHLPATWPIEISFEPSDARAEMQDWLGRRPVYSAQGTGGLGKRLADAMRRHFEKSDDPLIMIGGDCPYLDQAHFAEVEASLTHTDVVLVPAMDGGYCLIALRRAEARVFEEISWSTPSVLSETQARLKECGLCWRELDVLEDVDDLASWKRAMATFPELRSADERTTAA